MPLVLRLLYTRRHSPPPSRRVPTSHVIASHSSLVWLAALVALTACNRTEAPSSGAGPAPSHSSTSSVTAPKHAPLADESVDIPEGSFLAGSTPGDPGRRPELEPRRYRVELGPYGIDRLPYPNDPAQPPLTGVTRAEASRRCAERGARLCTELEWERACKGPQSTDYAGGSTWDVRCSNEPNSCASAFDVLGLGALREWTASDVPMIADRAARGAAVRGAAASAPAPEHRCAARTAVPDDTKAADLGFRCCKGPPNAGSVKEPARATPFQKLTVSAERLTKLLAAEPTTRDLAKDVKFFREPDAANTVVDRGPGDRKGFQFTVTPLLWNPAPGAEYLIVTARSGESVSFVLAYYVLGSDEYRLASSFIMKNEPGPVALAYSPDIKPRLHFSTCWGCPGETGKVLYRPPDSVALLQP